MSFRDMADVRRANGAAGYHFFNPDTMEFFHSRVESELLFGRWFVTSEQYDPDRPEFGPRAYTARSVSPDARVRTARRGFATAKAAERWVGEQAAGALVAFVDGNLA